MTSSTPSFTIARDPDWSEIDLLGERAEEMLGDVAAQALRLAADGEGGMRVLMARSLMAPLPDGPPLSIGLMVVLADSGAALPDAPLTPADLPREGAAVSAVELPIGSGVRVRDTAPGPVVGGQPLPTLRVQYLIHTPHGLLTITLSTARAAQDGIWEALFDAIAATARWE